MVRRRMIFWKSAPASAIPQRSSELTSGWRAVLEVYREWADAKYHGTAKYQDNAQLQTLEPSPQSPAADPFAELIDQTLWEEQDLRDILEALRSNRSDHPRWSAWHGKDLGIRVSQQVLDWPETEEPASSSVSP